MRAVDRSFDDLFRGSAGGLLQITNPQRTWHDSTLTFSFEARMGLLRSPISGLVEVTASDVTIDADLGLLGRLFSPAQAKAFFEQRIRGLLG